MAAFAVPLVASGISALVGGLFGRKQTQQTSTTTTPTFDPTIAPLLSQSAGVLSGQIQDPGKQLEPLRLAARDRVSSMFAGGANALAAQSLAHGGKSGKYGTTLRKLEADKFSALQGSDMDFYRLAMQRQESGLDLASRLISLGRGQTQQSTSTGSPPGGVAGGALGSGVQTAAYLYALNHMLGGGGGGGGIGGYGVLDPMNGDGG